MSDRIKPKSPRKRRHRHRYRRRPSSKGTFVPSESNVPTIAEQLTPPATEPSTLPIVRERSRPKPKLDQKFILEESEVKTSLEQLHDTQTDLRNGKPQLHQVDKEILFFTDSLSGEDFYDAEENPKGIVLGGILFPSTKNLDVQNASSQHSSSSSNDTDTPTHLASSYFRTDEGTSVIVPWKTQKYKCADQSLMYYQPERVFPASRGFLEEVCVIDPKNSGDTERKDSPKRIAIIPPKRVSIANKNRLMNRLLEEEQEEWFDASGELVDFQQCILGKERVRGFCSKTFVPFFVEPMPLAKTVEQLPMERTLKILIGILCFDDHPSFEEVVRLRLKLEQLYKQYYRIHKLNRKEVLQANLIEMRAKKDRQKEEEEQDKFQFKMARRELRKLIYQEMRTERRLAKQIVELWEALKEKQLNCGLKMTVNSQDTHEELDGSDWQERFELELQETLDEEFEIYIRDKQEYKAYLRDLVLDQQPDIGANTNVRPSVQKPKKPDTAKLTQEFRMQFDAAFRAPGEPQVNIVLQRDPERTVDHKDHGGSDLLFKVKLLVDGNHVASTKARHFQEGSRTVVDFNTSFSIKLTTRIPETIALNLFEKNRLGMKNKRAEIFIPLPSTGELYDMMVPVDYQFSCGRPYKMQSYVNGTIELKIGWLEQVDGCTFPSPSHRRTVPRRVVVPQELVRRCFDDHALDVIGGDLEADSAVLKALKDGSNNRSDGQKIGSRRYSVESLRTNEELGEFQFNEDLLAFCSKETIEQNERLQMLSKRFNSSLMFRDAKFIPQSERELAFPNREDEEQTKIIDETLGTDPIDLQRHRGKRYLQQVYAIISNHCRVLNQDKVNNSNLLIGGDQVLTFRALSMAFLEIFGPRRPLKPSRRSPIVRTSIRQCDVTHFKIIVTIVRSFGIPMRTEDYQSTASAGRRNSNMSSSNGRFSFRTSNVRPYIAVSIKDRVLRTSTADGTAPTWNEQLELPLDCSTDQIRKHLHIDLYDEYMEDLLEDDRTRPTEVYQRISSRWLGQLRIPISTIYLNQRLEGTFEINTPPILFGYDRQQSQASDNPEAYAPSVGTFGSSLPNMRELTHVSLFISLDPLIERPTLDTGSLECVELELIKTRIYLWYGEYRHEFPARAIVSPMVTLLGGKRICATRLLGPLPIPFAINEMTEAMLRRYVSLIPIHYSIDPCSQLSGIWLTNKEILTMMCASPKDLGVMLACFYLHLGYDVWLIFGNSALMGDTTFVLLLEAGEFFIVDPCSGKKYSSTDTYCPLNRIYLIVNQVNVWGNVQKENRVFLTQLDVDSFAFKEALSTRELQQAIERKLIRKIATWRTHRKTVWNRFISDHLRSTLINLERDACLEMNTERYADDFTQMFISYKVNGFPINLPYGNLSTIVAQVKGTGIHMNSETGVEFALGVYIKGYPCNVYSVWIFLMSLVPRM